MRARIVAKRWTPRVLFLLALALTSCGSLVPAANPPVSTSEGSVQTSPLAQLSPLPTPSNEPAQASLELVVLHTNDNWGETEPCG
jgi:hypothetical protein